MTAYMCAPDVEKIASSLIADVDTHQVLAEVRVEYVFIEKAPKSKGRLVLGRARKVAGLPAFLASGVRPVIFETPPSLFVVEIAHDTWEHLDDNQRVALVDHELCHLCVDHDEDTGLPVLSTRGHDIEEFAAVVARHGLWNAGAAKLGQALSEQLVLAIEEIASFGDGLTDQCGTDPDPDDPEGSS